MMAGNTAGRDLSAELDMNIHQFEALFKYATIGIVMTDHLGQILNFNQYAETQFGYSREELIGKPVEVLIPNNLHGVHVQHRMDFYRDPGPRRMGEGRDLYALKKDGTKFPVEVSLSHYTIDSEHFVIAFVIDITVRKKSEAVVLTQKADLEKVKDDILQLNEQLEQKVDSRTVMLRETLAELERSKTELSEKLELEKELSELKNRFVTTASHEFRTPLSTILSSTYLLEKFKPEEYEEKKAKHIDRIKKAVAGMKGILEDFLSLGKLEEGKVQVKVELIDAGAFVTEIQSVIGELEHLLKERQEVNLISDVSTTNVNIDTHLFRNIVLNMVSNALKFSNEQSAIIVKLILSEKEIVFSVSDRGIGISPEDQQHLFERFFRGRNATNIQGTGLGLHIISKYLELLNGTIGIESVLGEGSTFTIYIPQVFQTNQRTEMP